MDEFLKSDAVWRRFLCNLGDYAIVILDEVGTVVGWNEGARTMKGYTAEEIVGSHFSVFYTPEAQGCSTLFSESLMQQVPGIEARRAREDSAG
jgi:PAS domain S-box-containing protein